MFYVFKEKYYECNEGEQDQGPDPGREDHLCEIYGAPADVQRYLDMGVKDVCFGDMTMVYNMFLRQKGAEMREIVNRVK